MRNLIAAALGVATLLGWPAHAALLFQQSPELVTANAVANGTEFQAPFLADTLSFQGTARRLTWWGTAGRRAGRAA